MNDKKKTDVPGEEESRPTSLRTRILAGLAALAVLALSIAYAYSIATGGIFWF